MLYLPPDIAHEGTAIDECMTYSIGFRAPLYQELAEAFLDHLRDAIDIPGRYADPDLRAGARGRRASMRQLRRRVARAIAQIRWDAADVARFHRPLPDRAQARASCSPRRRRNTRSDSRAASPRDGVRLDRRTQLLYDDARYYLNGDDAPLPDADRAALRRLADRRALTASRMRSAVARR